MRAIIIFILWLILGFFYWSQKTSCCGAVSSETELVPASTDKQTLNHDADSIKSLNARADTSEVAASENSSQDKTQLDSNNNTSTTELNGHSNNRESRDGKSSIYQGETIKKEKGRTLIYFDYNDGSKIRNQEISDYLSQVSRSLRNNLDKVVLNGHTDNEGSESANYALGLRRAQQVKELLVRKGVSPQRILTYSKGEKRPIASNDTEEGRQQNRRVELIVIK